MINLWIDLKFLRRLNGNANTTIVYHYLEQVYTTDANEENDWWFKCPFGEIMESLGMGEFKVRKALKDLSEKKLIEYKNKGVPRTMWVKMKFNN